MCNNATDSIHSKIEPIKLESAILLEMLSSPSPGNDASFAFNSMHAIAQSPITGYFYKRARAFNNLAGICDMSPNDLAAKSYGEVACIVARACNDDMASVARPQPSKASLPSRDFSSHAQEMLKGLLEPLVQTAFTCFGDLNCLLPSQWEELSCTPRVPDRGARLQLSATEPHQDYFRDHLVGQKRVNPESRLKWALSFEWRAYREAVGRVTGSEDDLDSVLESFDLDIPCHQLGLLEAVRQLANETESWTLDPFAFDEYLLDYMPDSFPDSPDSAKDAYEQKIALAYDALYLLLVQPYALIHMRHH